MYREDEETILYPELYSKFIQKFNTIKDYYTNTFSITVQTVILNLNYMVFLSDIFKII